MHKNGSSSHFPFLGHYHDQLKAHRMERAKHFHGLMGETSPHKPPRPEDEAPEKEVRLTWCEVMTWKTQNEIMGSYLIIRAIQGKTIYL